MDRPGARISKWPEGGSVSQVRVKPQLSPAAAKGRKTPPVRDSHPKEGRANDRDVTRADILEVATQEFAEMGLSGSRIDWIADRTKTSKRMIYYYFGSKEGLYRAVLAECYRRIRAIEATL